MSSSYICDKSCRQNGGEYAANPVVILVSTATAFITFSALLYVLDDQLK